MAYAKSTHRRIRKSREFRPDFVILEGRQLLSKLYPDPDPTTTIDIVENTPIGTGPPVIGGPFSSTVRFASSDPIARLVAVTWKFQSPDGNGVIAKQTVDSTGYHTTYVTAMNQASADGFTVTLDSLNWGAASGNYTVISQVSYVDSSGAHETTRSYTEHVSAPTGTLIATPSTTTIIPNKTGNGGIIRAGNLLYPGIMVEARVDPMMMVDGVPTQVNGIYGIVQTIALSIVEQIKDEHTGVIDTWRVGRLAVDGSGTLVPLNQYPSTWNDTLESFKFPYYNFTTDNGIAVPTPSPVGTLLKTSILDIPQAEWDDQAIRIDAHDHFIDTLMFRPSGSTVAVPLGSLTWDWNVSAARENPSLPMTRSTPWNDITSTSYQPGNTFPTWAYKGTMFVNPNNRRRPLRSISETIPDNYKSSAPQPPISTTATTNSYQLVSAQSSTLTPTQTSTLTTTQSSTLTPIQTSILTPTQTSTLTPSQMSKFVLSPDSAAIPSQNVIYVPPLLASVILGIDLLSNPYADWAKFQSETGLTYHDIVDATYPGANYLSSASTVTTQPSYADMGYVDYSGGWNDYLSYYVDYKNYYSDYSAVYYADYLADSMP